MAKGRIKGRKERETQFQDFVDDWKAIFSDLDLGNFLQAIALMRAGRILDLEFDRMCRREHRISGSDMRVLLTLRRSGEPFEQRPTDLFKAILVSSGGMSRQIDRLDERGLVTRRADSRHGGGFLIGLTPDGKAIVDRVIDRLATRSLLLGGTAGMSAAQKKSGESYVFALLAALERDTGYGITLPLK